MEIETSRLYLREVADTDYDFIYELENNEFIQKFEADIMPSKEDIDKKFFNILESKNKTPRTKYTLIITRLPDFTPVGRVIIWEIDSTIREWEMGWDVHPDYIGKGYATEAARALLEFAFNKLGVHRVQALCNDKNSNSEKVMIKIGMKKEGTCRGVRFLNNTWYGSHIYALLEDDFNNKYERILNKVIVEHHRLLNNNLVGIYLHGSIAMGCFNENLSDIDYIVVVKEKIPFETKRRIIDFLIDLSHYAPGKGIEMSIVLERDVKNFIYPTPFELHYSKEHNLRYVNDTSYICGDSVDKDLAAHITVINHRGVCLYGKPINEVFGEVPEVHYIDSIIHDIKNAQDEILNNPVYFVLNLCRVLYYLRERVVSSKYEGGQWAKGILPGKYFDLIERAINMYEGKEENIEWNENELENYAKYMLSEINQYA